MSFSYLLPQIYDEVHKKGGCVKRILAVLVLMLTFEVGATDFLSIFAAKEKQRFKLKVGVFVVLEEEGKVLLLRRFQTGISDGKYVLPMGGHDGKEPLTSALIREAKEEINIDLNYDDVSVCHVMHRFHPMPEGLSFEQIDVFFKVKSYQGSITNNEPDHCDELAFFSIRDLPENIDPFIRYALQCIQKGEGFSEFGFEDRNGVTL